MITGRVQVGDHGFLLRRPAQQGVAGDGNDTSGPTYNALEGLLDATDNEVGILVAGSIDHDGNVRYDVGDYGKRYQVSNAYYEASTGHNIAGPFWTFLNQSGTVYNKQGIATNGRLFDPVFYATGLPITEPYWARVKVGGVVKDVLVQAFERRIMTFTPSNSPAFQVEMGNVGRHYYDWRYDGNTPTPHPQSACADVPNPINANLRPGKCVNSGEILSMDVGNFFPNEQIGFWLTDPFDDVVAGTNKTFSIGETGNKYNLQYDTSDLYPGQWYFVFQGATSGRKAIVYFYINDYD